MLDQALLPSLSPRLTSLKSARMTPIGAASLRCPGEWAGTSISQPPRYSPVSVSKSVQQPAA